MNADMVELFENRIIVSLVSGIVGALISTLFSKIRNKTSVFRYSTNIERVALSANDPVFGSVQVTWQSSSVRNLFIVTVLIENTCMRDFENVPFKIYTDSNILLLSERTAIVGTPYIVQWSDNYKKLLEVQPGQKPTAQQWGFYNHSREYNVSVFNRGKMLEFRYLCTNPKNDDSPGIFVDTLFRGAKLVYEVRSNIIHGVPVPHALLRGLIVSIFVAIACGYYVGNVWIATMIAMVVGLFAQSIGAMAYKAEYKMKQLIAG